MSKIKVITDSTADISAAIAKKLDIDIIPLNIFFGEEKFKDGVTITAKEVYKRTAEQKKPWPKTSQPSANEFLEFYNKIFDKGYETIFSIHVTQNMSGTLNSVNTAIKQLPKKDIIAIDSNTATISLGLTVYEVAKMVKKGNSKDEILKALQKTIIPNIHAVGVINTLENLYRGGRIGRAKKVLGTLLNMKPLMQIKDGFVDSFGKVKGHDEAFTRFVEMTPKIFEGLAVKTIWLGYTDNDTYTKQLYESIKNLPNAPEEISIHEIGPTVGTHLGPGAMLMAWIGKWNEKWFLGEK